MSRHLVAALVGGALSLAGLVIVPAAASTPTLAVTASRPSLSASGGSVTISATVPNAKTCTWTSNPQVGGFDGTVKCAAKLSRVVKLSANTTPSAKRFTFALATTSGSGKASASAVVSEAGKGAASPELSGMGATVAQMTKAHGVDQIRGGACSAAPHCFGAPIKNDEDALYQITGVSVDGGIIDGYTQAFVNGTTIAQAESEVLQWMPKDAKMTAISIDHNGGSCAMADISSPTLAKLFSTPKIGDPKGIVGVEFGYIEANLDQVYNPKNVEHAFLTDTPSDPTSTC